MGSEARTLSETNSAELAGWCGGLPVVQHDALDPGKAIPGINVPTAKGVERASLGDMIIRRDDGQFEIFKNS
jgi:hypothetical protein